MTKVVSILSRSSLMRFEDFLAIKVEFPNGAMNSSHSLGAQPSPLKAKCQCPTQNKCIERALNLSRMRTANTELN